MHSNNSIFSTLLASSRSVGNVLLNVNESTFMMNVNQDEDFTYQFYKIINKEFSSELTEIERDFVYYLLRELFKLNEEYINLSKEMILLIYEDFIHEIGENSPIHAQEFIEKELLSM